jgi:hypothetical protein
MRVGNLHTPLLIPAGGLPGTGMAGYPYRPRMNGLLDTVLSTFSNYSTNQANTSIANSQALAAQAAAQTAAAQAATIAAANKSSGFSLSTPVMLAGVAGLGLLLFLRKRGKRS